MVEMVVADMALRQDIYEGKCLVYSGDTESRTYENGM